MASPSPKPKKYVPTIQESVGDKASSAIQQAQNMFSNVGKTAQKFGNNIGSWANLFGFGQQPLLNPVVQEAAAPTPTPQIPAQKWNINPPKPSAAAQAQQQQRPTATASPEAFLASLSQVDPAAAKEFSFMMGQQKYPQAQQQISRFYNKLGNPPLSKNSGDFIAAGEKYGVDPRVMVMVGQMESSGGKNYPPNTYNPFGYLGGKGPTVNDKLDAGFTSVPHAIDRITRRFSKETPNYQNFKKQPTIPNLVKDYNANPAEEERYNKVLSDLLQYIQ
jgi:hypothetical protein